MFTPGFRLFFGFAIAGLIAAFVYGVTSVDGGSIDYLGFIDAEAWIGALSLGWKGSVGDHVGYFLLLLFAAVAGFIGLMLVAFRDADPKAVSELAGGQLPPAQPPTVPTYWPLVGAFGAGVTVIGLVTHAALFVAGLLILLAVAIEWMMSAWADRATGDPVANQELRNRIMGPIEVPLLGTIGAAVLVLAVSRVFLAVSKEWAVWIAVMASAVVFLVAIGFALMEKPNRNAIAVVLSLGAIGVLAGGIVSASIGERDFHEHEEEEHSEEDEGALG